MTGRDLDQLDEFRVRYGYNDIVFATAGEVVSCLSGIGWGDFVGQRIFQPLEMARSTTRGAVVETRGNVSASYTRPSTCATWSTGTTIRSPPPGAGGGRALLREVLARRARADHCAGAGWVRDFTKKVKRPNG